MAKSKKPTTPVKKKKPVKKKAVKTKPKTAKYVAEDHYWDWDEPFYEQY